MLYFSYGKEKPNKEFLKIKDIIKDISPENRNELMDMFRVIKDSYGDDIKSIEVLNDALQRRSDDFIKDYIEKAKLNEFITLAKEVVVIPEKIKNMIEVDVEKITELDLENAALFKFGIKESFYRVKEPDIKYYEIVGKINEDDINSSKEAIKKIELSNVLTTKHNVKNIETEIQKAIENDYVVNAESSDEKIMNILINSELIKVITFYREKNNDKPWINNNITLEMPIKELSKVSEFLSGYTVEDMLVASCGDYHSAFESFSEWLNDDIDKFLEEAFCVRDCIGENVDFGNIKIEDSILYVQGKELDENSDISDDIIEAIKNNKDFKKYVIEKSEETSSFEDYISNMDSNFWCSYEMDALFENIFGNDYENDFVVCGSNVNWRNQGFKDNVVIDCDPVALMDKLVPNSGEYTLNVYKVYNENTMNVSCYHHDCPTGSHYSVITLKDYVNSSEISNIRVIRKALEFYDKEYIREHFFDKDVFFKTELIMEMFKEEYIDGLF